MNMHAHQIPTFHAKLKGNTLSGCEAV